MSEIKITPLWGGSKDYRVTGTENMSAAMAAVREILPADRQLQNASRVVGENEVAVFTSRKPRFRGEPYDPKVDWPERYTTGI